MRVAFYTLGCKLNQAETESLANCFGQAGFEVTSWRGLADIYIANTCTVTHIADSKSRRCLRLARRRNPQALVIATGCYAQRSPRELAALADLVVGNAHKQHLLSLLQALSLRFGQMAEGERNRCQIPGAARTRSLIKIQDGCHSSCTYCIVPRVRPREYSLPASQILDQVNRKVSLGYKEVVLTGTKIGSYKDNGTNLKDLIERILRETSVNRLRLSSLQPSEITADFLELWQDERLCRNFHLALQSGSDAVLQRMKRSYSLEQYQTTIDLIREKIPDAAITTDIMVGFPGETDQEFEQSYSFCQQAGFANIHVFPFSPRAQTMAAYMPNQIIDKVKQERKERMLELAQACHRSFCRQFLGQTMPVLWEKEMPTFSSTASEGNTKAGNGIYSGLTSNYMRVFVHSDRPLTNQMTRVRLVRLHKQGVWAEPLNENPG